MIQIRELRIGNLVGHQDSDYTSDEDEIHFTGHIDAINERTVIVSDGLTTGTSLSYQELIAIPLTPEWLEKLGLRNGEHESVFNGYRARPFSTASQGIFPGEWQIVLCGSIPYSIYRTYQFVHQIQNFHFVLTGKELEVKL